MMRFLVVTAVGGLVLTMLLDGLAGPAQRSRGALAAPLLPTPPRTLSPSPVSTVCPPIDALGQKALVKGHEGPAATSSGLHAYKIPESVTGPKRMCTYFVDKEGRLTQTSEYLRDAAECSRLKHELTGLYGSHANDPGEAIWRISGNTTVRYADRPGVLKCVVERMRFDLIPGASAYGRWPLANGPGVRR